jgi:hypothetical protein
MGAQAKRLRENQIFPELFALWSSVEVTDQTRGKIQKIIDDLNRL